MTAGSERSVEDCPHRVTVAGTGSQAQCGYLAGVVGAADRPLFDVQRDACVACCRTSPPEPEVLNGVTASLLYHIATRIIKAGGVEACDLGKAVGLQRWAWHNIPVSGLADPLDLTPFLEVGEARLCSYLGTRLDSPDDAGECCGDQTRFSCEHSARSETTPSACRVCRDWRRVARSLENESDSNDTTAAVSIENESPFDVLRTSNEPALEAWRGALPRFHEWAVGVTTCAREIPTVDLCLDSLRRAGWSDISVFADGPVEIAERHRDLPCSQRPRAIGAWPNFYTSLTELVETHPTAEVYLMVQDDVVFYDREDLPRFLERHVPLDEDVGFVSLYCSSKYTHVELGWHTLDRPWVWGACAMLFSADAVKRLLTDRELFDHRWTGYRNGTAGVDVAIGKWVDREKLRAVYPTPSLVQHIGDKSTIWTYGQAAQSRSAESFRR